MDYDSLAHEVRIAQPQAGESDPVPSPVSQARTISMFDEKLLDAAIDNRLPQPVKELIQRCLEGTEPVPELRYWENDKFGPEHVNIALLRASGMKPKEIQQVTGMSYVRISVIINHPYSKKIVAALVPERSVRVLDIRTRMEVFASEMLDKMFEAAMDSDKIEDIQKVGFGLLDRVGHGPINKSVSTSVPPSAFGDGGGSGGDEKTLGRIATALEESNMLDRELMPNFQSQRPPEQGSLPAGSEIGLGGPGGQEVEHRVPSSPPTSKAEAAD